MTKPKPRVVSDWQESRHTDGVWAGSLQNRWFLAQRELGAGKQADVGEGRGAVRCDGTDDLNSTDQAHCMARLAISAGLRGR